ncbi:DEAD/DEAH box helicase family protein [Streptomyces clavifer]|uniref:DEAD/DEAH box helicase family protein n=1 Tax=Streptomyces clavifer TaxID=68188 RepID=UPI0037A41F00
MSHALRPYQQEAVEAISAGLREEGRGRLHAACGSGKTLISAMTGARLVPARDLHPDEHAGLRKLTGCERGAAIVQLIDDGVTQSSIAAALGSARPSRR